MLVRHVSTYSCAGLIHAIDDIGLDLIALITDTATEFPICRQGEATFELSVLFCGMALRRKRAGVFARKRTFRNSEPDS